MLARLPLRQSALSLNFANNWSRIPLCPLLPKASSNTWANRTFRDFGQCKPVQEAWLLDHGLTSGSLRPAQPTAVKRSRREKEIKVWGRKSACSLMDLALPWKAQLYCESTLKKEYMHKFRKEKWGFTEVAYSYVIKYKYLGSSLLTFGTPREQFRLRCHSSRRSSICLKLVLPRHRLSSDGLWQSGFERKRLP